MGATKKRTRGRPEAREPYVKATVILYRRQLAYLDGAAVEIRRMTGAVVTRADMIRALIDALQGAEFPLTSVESEGALREAVTARLRKRR